MNKPQKNKSEEFSSLDYLEKIQEKGNEALLSQKHETTEKALSVLDFTVHGEKNHTPVDSNYIELFSKCIDELGLRDSSHTTELYCDAYRHCQKIDSLFNSKEDVVRVGLEYICQKKLRREDIREALLSIHSPENKPLQSTYNKSGNYYRTEFPNGSIHSFQPLSGSIFHGATIIPTPKHQKSKRRVYKVVHSEHEDFSVPQSLAYLGQASAHEPEEAVYKLELYRDGEKLESADSVLSNQEQCSLLSSFYESEQVEPPSFSWVHSLKMRLSHAHGKLLLPLWGESKDVIFYNASKSFTFFFWQKNQQYKLSIPKNLRKKVPLYEEGSLSLLKRAYGVLDECFYFNEKGQATLLDIKQVPLSESSNNVAHIKVTGFNQAFEKYAKKQDEIIPIYNDDGFIMYFLGINKKRTKLQCFYPVEDTYHTIRLNAFKYIVSCRQLSINHVLIHTSSHIDINNHPDGELCTQVLALKPRKLARNTILERLKQNTVFEVLHSHVINVDKKYFERNSQSFHMNTMIGDHSYVEVDAAREKIIVHPLRKKGEVSMTQKTVIPFEGEVVAWLEVDSVHNSITVHYHLENTVTYTLPKVNPPICIEKADKNTFSQPVTISHPQRIQGFRLKGGLFSRFLSKDGSLITSQFLPWIITVKSMERGTTTVLYENGDEHTIQLPRIPENISLSFSPTVTPLEMHGTYALTFHPENPAEAYPTVILKTSDTSREHCPEFVECPSQHIFRTEDPHGFAVYTPRETTRPYFKIYDTFMDHTPLVQSDIFLPHTEGLEDSRSVASVFSENRALVMDKNRLYIEKFHFKRQKKSSVIIQYPHWKKYTAHSTLLGAIRWENAPHSKSDTLIATVIRATYVGETAILITRHGVETRPRLSYVQIPKTPTTMIRAQNIPYEHIKELDEFYVPTSVITLSDTEFMVHFAREHGNSKRVSLKFTLPMGSA